MNQSDNDFADALTSDRLRTFHGIWKTQAAGRLAPRRDQMTPARLRATMPWTFLMEVAGADFRFGFAGDRIVQFVGKAHAGTLLSALLGTPFYDGMHRFFSRCTELKTPQHVGPLRAVLPGKDHLEMEVVVLPLSDDGTTVTALLGAFDTWRAGTHTSLA